MIIETNEAIASQDLDVKGYAGKWRAAKEIAAAGPVSSHLTGLPYWETVRCIFLELGGERLDRMRC